MKNKIFLCLMLFSSILSAQKYYTKTGATNFKASVDAFEPVEASSNSSTAILNAESGEVAALIFVRSFHFKVALMEEHFNENYMDSDQFPKASFKGKLENFKWEDLASTEKEYSIMETITIHGKTQELQSTVRLKFFEGTLYVNSSFEIKAEDFGVEIPSVVREKIAKTVKIYLEYEMVKKE